MMPYVNNEIYYEVYGEGRPLMLIHGAWASHEWWRMQIPEFSKKYKVIAIDVRGHGKSARLEKPTTVQKLAEDVDKVLNTLGISEIVLVGWSMGGMLSTQYYFEHPEKVKGLVLISSRLHKRPRMLIEAYLRTIREMFTLFMDFADFEGFESLKYEDEVKKEVQKMFSSSTDPEIIRWAIEDLTKNRRRDYINIVKTLAKYDASDKLHMIKVPMLIIVGDKDERTPPEFAKKIHEKVPHSKLIIIEGYGHYMLIERPDIVNKEIIDFLQSIGYR
ncbi:MAG: alpha/beta hydrolase [Nitrososphaerota archaeon]